MRALLKNLIRWRQKHFTIETILVLGDSHAMVFRHWLFEVFFPGRTFRICSVPGATISGLENPNSKTQAIHAFRDTLADKKYNRYVITILGEVDAGFVIWYKSQKDGEPIEDLVQRTLDRYIDFLNEVASVAIPIVISVPLPTIGDGEHHGQVANLRSSISATQRQRTELTLTINRNLADICLKRGWHFIGLDAYSLGDNGLVKSSLLSRNRIDHHYRRRAYAFLLARELRRQGAVAMNSRVRGDRRISRQST